MISKKKFFGLHTTHCKQSDEDVVLRGYFLVKYDWCARGRLTGLPSSDRFLRVHSIPFRGVLNYSQAWEVGVLLRRIKYLKRLNEVRTTFFRTMLSGNCMTSEAL